MAAAWSVHATDGRVSVRQAVRTGWPRGPAPAIRRHPTGTLPRAASTGRPSTSSGAAHRHQQLMLGHVSGEQHFAERVDRRDRARCASSSHRGEATPAGGVCRVRCRPDPRARAVPAHKARRRERAEAPRQARDSTRARDRAARAGRASPSLAGRQKERRQPLRDHDQREQAREAPTPTHAVKRTRVARLPPSPGRLDAHRAPLPPRDQAGAEHDHQGGEPDDVHQRESWPPLRQAASTTA